MNGSYLTSELVVESDVIFEKILGQVLPKHGKCLWRMTFTTKDTD